MLAVIALLVTCLMAGSTATKSSGHITYGGYKGIVPHKPIPWAPRKVIRHYVGSRQPTAVITASRPAPRTRMTSPSLIRRTAGSGPPTPVITASRPAPQTRMARRRYYSPEQIFSSGFSQGDASSGFFDENSFSSFAAEQGTGQEILMPENAFMMPNNSPMEVSQSFNAAVGDYSGIEYGSNALPVVY